MFDKNLFEQCHAEKCYTLSTSEEQLLPDFAEQKTFALNIYFMLRFHT